MLLACLPVIISGTTRGRAAYDSLNYHEKAIRQFAQELPKPNLQDYLSATTPGYHLALSTVGRAIGVGSDGKSAYDIVLFPNPASGVAPDPTINNQRRVLQLAGLCFTLVLLYSIGSWSERRIAAGGLEPGPAIAAVVLCLPLIGSPYIYQSAAWLLPDNSAWLGVVAVVLLALRPRVTLPVLALMGAIVVWLVVARQIHAWAAGMVWLAAWLSASLPAQRDRAGGPILPLRDLFNQATISAAVRNLLLAMVFTIPAAAALLGFWLLWNHQLVPPTFVAWHHAGLQLATPAFILSLVALAAPFFCSWLRPGLLIAWRDHRGAIFVAAAIGLLLAVVPPTAWDFEHGRFGGVWGIYRKVGAVGGRSLALAVLAPVGAVVVTGALAGMTARQRWTMLGALAGFAVANCANPQLWQRYHEPFVLVWLVLASALIAQQALPTSRQRAWRLVGPAALAVLLAAMNAVLVLRTEPQYDKGYRLGSIETPPDQKPQSERGE
ncbi:MAG: hypothetical protein QM783_00335 [Phycisphaerales bacterium]